MSLIKNSFAVLGVIAVGVVGADFLMPEEQQTKIKTSVMHLIKPEHADATRKITVYQSQGQRGEATFSDRQNGQARPRIVDNTKGTTFHTDPPKQELEQEGSNFKQSPLQQKAAAFKQAQMDHIINQ
ncbi:hypothetical protein [Aquirhabdus parva]|uniref:Uncharacterized protein n=1 Tax=Aquirhabdus parva TaxID=2283318 RepID=A0A345P867_9GAMM|nr:hypothetical protein [Aquirhabdus parva]AXI03476.1 hypothetical protein HYN46_11870 [Aquirhabdus parva]